MHTGQIILLAKMLADIDLVFYDFSIGANLFTHGMSRKNSQAVQSTTFRLLLRIRAN